jgi:hypothetical protein
MYTKHSACHWLVNFSLRLANLVRPTRPWCILTSDKHSTVWDQDRTLFDFNFQAMKIAPKECFDAAAKEKLEDGQYLEVHFLPHWKTEMQASNKWADLSI